MNFLQFFVWGSWLITISNYWFATKGWGPAEFGAIFSTMGISALFMPALMGMVADRWINAERLYGVLHLLCGLTMLSLPMLSTPVSFFWGIMVAMLFYMPTISLANAVAYTNLKAGGLDVVRDFPPIRVFGTIGFIVAMWLVNLSGNKATPVQFYVAAAGGLVLGLYAFTLPKCPPLGAKDDGGKKSLAQFLGLDALSIFKDRRMALFFLFSIFLGAALQLTNMYGDVYLGDFGTDYPDSFVVRYSTIIMSISQMSETLFILAIPFFLHRFGIKNVMLISMLAWVARFGLFAYGNPTDGLWMIILSCVAYGMAFDFFNISGSLFVETSVDARIRSSAQGLFMMATNGVGAIMGSMLSGYMVREFFTTASGGMMWHGIWLTFAIYALIVAVLFSVFFRYKHDPTMQINH